jgi:membrane peptidoglycan carboxypeptidase
VVFPYPAPVNRMRGRDHNLLTNGVSLLICGLLAGVVVAAAMFPAVAMSGLAAKAGAETFDKLPSELEDQRAPQITRIYARDGKTLIAMMYFEFRSDVPLKDISKNMQNAIIAAEDHDFYKHNGVDVKGIARAFVANKGAGKTQQGASTLTMQYVRMSISYSATHPIDVVKASEDTAARKAREMRYALKVEQELTKDEILERYLNIAPFGNGAYGVYAASQVYFGKRPKDLTIEESAQLAGMVKAPTAFNPSTESGYPQAVTRREYVLRNMLQLGQITQADFDKAAATRISRDVKRAGNGCVSVPKNNWGFFCDYFYRWWMGQETFGDTSYDRERRLKTGGYKIVTSLDTQVQAAATKRVQQHLKNDNKYALMLASVEPGTGRVRSLAVNRTFKLDDPAHPKNGPSSNPGSKGQRGTYPNTTNPLVTGGGDITGYQGGSVFKMFTLAAALEAGYPLSYTINARTQYVSKYRIQPGPASCQGDRYCPRNASPSMAGVHTMWSAFGRSVNTFFIPLQERVGSGKAVDMAEKLGIRFRSSTDRDQYSRKDHDDWGAFSLGVTDVTPLDLATAYATLAADGKYCEPIPVQEIRDHNGDKLDVANPRCRRVVSEDVARAAVDAGRCPVGDRPAYGSCGGAGTASAVRGIVGHPVFGKSGTSDGAKTVSLIAGTKSLVVAGLLADPDWSQNPASHTHDQVNPAVWETLADAMKDKPQQDFKAPSEKMAYGDQRRIPDVTCDSVGDAQARLRGAGFEVEIGSGQVDSSCPQGSVAGTSPDGRTIKGGVVVIEISNGSDGRQNRPDGPGRPGRPVLPGLPGNPDNGNPGPTTRPGPR